MSSLYQVRSVVELTNQGWEALRFPDRDIENLIFGGNIYMANKNHDIIVVDSQGDAYTVDVRLETAKSNPPIYTSSATE